MSIHSRQLAVLIVLLTLGQAHGDYLEVRRSALVKSGASKDSPTILKVEPSATLVLESTTQKNGYYNVGVPGAEGSGWIYRTFVRRYPGNAPEPSPEEGEAGGPAPGTPAVTDSTTGDFHGCPPEGKGGDPVLNRLKNRDLPPAFYK